MTGTPNQLLEQITSRLCNRPGVSRDIPHKDIVLAAFALLKAKEHHPGTMPPFATMLEAISGNEIIRTELEVLADYWETFGEIYELCDSETLRQLIFVPQASFEFSTPNAINALALRLLSINDNDRVADLGTGNGGFLVDAHSDNPNADYLGVEIDRDSAVVASIRAELLGENVKVKQADMFSLWGESQGFSKAFSHHPFSVGNLREQLPESQPDALQFFPRSTSSDWLFNLLASDCLAKEGKAVAIMTRGACYNKVDSDARKHFVENGLIEAVIALPERLLSETAIATALVVLSKGNQTITMVDASEVCEKGRRQNELQDNHINAILEALNRDSEISRTITLAELAGEDFILDPAKLLLQPVSVKKGIALGEVVSIRRGAQVTAKELDEMVSDEPTDVQYLRLSDIEDGTINENLPFLKELAPRLQKYCVAPGNLLLSRNGAPFKMAVVDEGHGTVLATGNLLIIEPDERIRPLYLKAFLESETGTKVLSKTLVGTTIPVIQLEALRDTIIPCPPLAEQMEFEARYIASLQAIQDLKRQLANAIEISKNFFEEVVL